MTNNSIKSKQMKFRIAVSNVRLIRFQINYIVQEVWVFRKSKPSRKYCFEFAKQIAALKFQRSCHVKAWNLPKSHLWKSLFQTVSFAIFFVTMNGHTYKLF